MRTLRYLPLDRGTVDAIPHLRPDFRLSRLEDGCWVGHLVDGDGRIATEGTRLWRVATVPTELVGTEPYLLGKTSDGVIHVAWPVPSDHEQLSALTAVAAELSDDESLLAAQAVALGRWHNSHRFCARCGARVRSVEAGWATVCTECEHTEYPRTDPVVIVRITDQDDRLLLAHNTEWAGGRMSLLAGYIEAGESARRALQREIFEEVGLAIGDETYLGSQYWPGPRSLMLAFAVEVQPGQGDPVVDGAEIDHARFFTREELLAAFESGEVKGPGPSSIAGAIIHDWLAH